MKAWWAAALLCGCGDPASPIEVPRDGGAASSFIALTGDFAGYAGWEHFELHDVVAQAGSHVAGDRTIYLSQRPPPGATAFPVGTMIVKVVSAEARVFAMVKRGGGFNPEGAVGWEWLELIGPPERPAIRWRGLSPPMGQAYGDLANSSCNNCHTGAWDNDYVQAEPLKLPR